MGGRLLHDLQHMSDSSRREGRREEEGGISPCRGKFDEEQQQKVRRGMMTLLTRGRTDFSNRWGSFVTDRKCGKH